MKIQTNDITLVYDLVNHMRKKGMPDAMSGYLRFLLEDNIPMNIKIYGKLYSVAWRYWMPYVQAYYAFLESCNDESLSEVERTKKELLQHATELTDHALDY